MIYDDSSVSIHHVPWSLLINFPPSTVTKLLNLYISIMYSLTDLSITCIFVYISSCTLFCFNQLPLLALLANYSNCLPFNSDYVLTQQVESDSLLEIKKYKRKWEWNWKLHKIHVWTNLTRKFAKSKLNQRFRVDFSKAFYPLFYWLDGYDIYPPIVHLSLRFGTFLMAKASQMQSLTLMTLIFSPLLSAISENVHFQSISNLVWKWKPRFDRNGWKGKYVE